MAAAQKARQFARAEGAQVIVALTHLGVTSLDPVTQAPSGPLIDFASKVTGYDVIFGDHTNVQYSGTFNKALVVENLSKGASYARVQLTFDRNNNAVLITDCP